MTVNLLKFSANLLRVSACAPSAQSSRLFRSSSMGATKDAEITHTGIAWDDSDMRNVRFVNHEKEVNKSWAIDLIADVPPIECTKRVVSCDGGGGALGHPKVFINLDEGKPEPCGYCGLRFVLKH